jgi:hypothetical protein
MAKKRKKRTPNGEEEPKEPILMAKKKKRNANGEEEQTKSKPVLAKKGKRTKINPALKGAKFS